MHELAAAFGALPREMQQWLTSNLERGCNPQEMAQALIRSAYYDPAQAQAVVELAWKVARQVRTPQGMPVIDTSANTLILPDRAVEVLVALQRPKVVLLGSVLSEDECDAIVHHCAQRYTRSTVVDANDGSSIVDDARTSDMAFIPPGEHDIVERLDRRLSAIAQWPIECGENFQLQKYGVGHQYKEHVDWFDPAVDSYQKHLACGGQRVATFILYLTDVEQGGATTFPKIGLEVFPKKGSALFFLNTDAWHQPDRLTLHCGTPVVRGCKIIANKWLRAEPFASRPCAAANA